MYPLIKSKKKNKKHTKEIRFFFFSFTHSSHCLSSIMAHKHFNCATRRFFRFDDIANICLFRAKNQLLFVLGARTQCLLGFFFGSCECKLFHSFIFLLLMLTWTVEVEFVQRTLKIIVTELAFRESEQSNDVFVSFFYHHFSSEWLLPRIQWNAMIQSKL